MCSFHCPSLASCVEFVLKTDKTASVAGKINGTMLALGLCYDSRKAKNGDIFFCKGRDFHPDYLIDAVSKGVSCVICPKKYSYMASPDYPIFIFTDKVREVMARLSAFFYGFPMDKLTSVAVTGTKGKTGTSQMLKDVLNGKNGIRAEILRDLTDGDLTTPESPDLHRAAFDALNRGATHLICEISSQAVKDLRTHGVTFDIACFLNFSPDHISPAEHCCVEEYFLCKASLFLNCRRAIINASSDFGRQILGLCQKNSCPTVTFSCEREDTDLTAHDVICSEGGCSFTVCDNRDSSSERLFLSAFGSYNAENALCAYAVAKLLSVPRPDVFRALAASKTAGRGTVLTSVDRRISVIVDYAHNGLSFEKILNETRSLYPDSSITAVFGCPGNKAFVRRHQLPEAALKYADRIIICEDDSGSEGFERISDMMLENAEKLLSSYPEPEKTQKRASISLCKSRERAVENAVFSAYESRLSSVIAVLGRGDDRIMRAENGSIPCKSDVEIAQNTLHRVNERIELSAAFKPSSTMTDKKMLIALPENNSMIRSAVSSLLPFRNVRAALYCQGRYAPLIRDICYENGRLCHVCERSSDFLNECDFCFRSGNLPVFLSDEGQFPAFCSLISFLSFDTAVYISDKKGILIDGRTYVSALSYENAVLIQDRTRAADIAPLTAALKLGASEALLLDGTVLRALPAYLCGGSVCGTVVKKAT
ncbi:MAG: hypothetical protein E7634_01675 [Ruminococcaceae bacterium]|nr:hypothetical protein [Oscillospiraceae bacterium]